MPLPLHASVNLIAIAGSDQHRTPLFPSPRQLLRGSSHFCRFARRMDPPMVDCRSLIEFCRAFEKHRAEASARAVDRGMPSSPPSRARRGKSPLSHPFCEHSPFAALDAVVLLLVLAAVGVLAVPCLQFALRGAAEVLPAAVDLVASADPQYRAPAACGVILALVLAAGLALREAVGHQARKCGSPFCRGLKKAVEFDIQLEPKACVRESPQLLDMALGVRPLELGRDHKELEAELKKMAPVNGRAVLIFRAPCGCPAGRMEVWGEKKVRRKK